MYTMKTSTQHIKGLPDVNTYETRLGEYFDGTNRKEITDSLVAIVLDIIEERIEATGWSVTITNARFSSPAFYNFEGDTIEFDMVIHEEPATIINQMLRETIQYETTKNILQYYKSYNGYNSAYPQSLEQFAAECYVNSRMFDECLSIYITTMMINNRNPETDNPIEELTRETTQELLDAIEYDYTTVQQRIDDMYEEAMNRHPKNYYAAVDFIKEHFEYVRLSTGWDEASTVRRLFPDVKMPQQIDRYRLSRETYITHNGETGKAIRVQTEKGVMLMEDTYTDDEALDVYARAFNICWDM